MLKVFTQAGMTLSEFEIAKPNATVMQKFYSEFARLFIHTEYGDEGQPYDWSPSGKLMQVVADIGDFPEMHRESMPNMMFFKELQLLIGQYIGISDFSMRDVSKPDPARARIIMSGIANFIAFAEIAKEKFDDLNKKSVGYEEQLATAQQKNISLRKQLHNIKQQNIKEQQEANMVEQENNDLADQMQNLHSQGKKVTSEISGLKEKLIARQEHVASLVQSIEDKKEHIKLLESRIVSNPEEIKQNIQDMKAMVKTLQAEIKGKECLSNEFSHKQEALVSCHKDLEICMEALSQCGNAYREFQDQNKYLLNLRGQSAKNDTKLKELKNAYQLQVRKEKAQSDKIARLTASFREKAQKVQQRFDAGQEEYAAYIKNDDTAIRISELQSQCKDIRDNIVTIKEDFDDEVQHIQNEFAQLKESVMMYISSMTRAMSYDVQFGEM